MSARPNSFTNLNPSSLRQARRKRTRQFIVEQLEDRRLLTVASPPDQPLNLTSISAMLASGHFDAGAASDLVSVAKNGQIDIALNNNSNAWQSSRTSAPIRGSVFGGATALLDGDPFDDLVLQTSAGIQVLRSDGAGAWNVSQSIAYTGVVDAASHPSVKSTMAFLGSDLSADFVVPLPQANQVAIFLGNGAAGFHAPTYFNSGASNPTIVASGNVMAGPFVDLVIGHADGSLTFFEGSADGSFVNRLTLASVVGSTRSIKIADLDADGVNEVVVAGSTGAVILTQVADTLASSPIVNGDFSAGLTGWQVQAIGQAAGQTSGTIRANSGYAQLTENNSFLTTLSQTFVIPPNPQTIEFDLVALGLDPSAPGQLPDAFEGSLLTDNATSLVPTHQANSTAFVNFGSGTVISKATGVSIVGTKVTLNITGVAPGTRATLLFDLIGNPNGVRSTATIDNVRISPEILRNDSFIASPLAGPFVSPQDLAIGDVDGDGHLDIVISDTGLPALIVFNGDGNGGFTRETISTPFGAPTVLTLGSFTSPDAITDIAYAVAGNPRVVTPIVVNSTIPTAQLVSPATTLTLPATASAVSALGTIVFQFSERMFANSSSVSGSASNPSSYRLYNFGPDGIDNSGGSDDISFPITVASYNSVDNRATLSIDTVALNDPLRAAGSLYRIVALGADPIAGLRNLAGTRLDGGQDYSAIVSLTRTPILTGFKQPSSIVLR